MSMATPSTQKAMTINPLPSLLRFFKRTSLLFSARAQLHHIIATAPGVAGINLTLSAQRGSRAIMGES